MSAPSGAAPEVTNLRLERSYFPTAASSVALPLVDEIPFNDIKRVRK
jgi:hypothetical protein